MEEIVKAAEIAQEEIDRQAASDPSVKKVLKIVEKFIQTHRVMCYGGTAINSLLPKEDQFYDPEVDIPDYDFFSETPQLHAAKLADRIAKAGYGSVEVRPGVHMGTFKVFADYIGVADISKLDKPIFKKLWKDSVEKNGIHFVPPNFLRMSVYLELSRPKGDVSRWKKVYSRISLLNKHYPITCPKEQEALELYLKPDTRKAIEDLLIKDKVVLLGFNASMLQEKKSTNWMLPMDVLANPEKKEKVISDFMGFFEKYDKVTRKDYPAYGELMPAHTDIDDPKTKLTLVRVYETDACHSYHEMKNGLLIASIPTLLQFFLSVLYAPAHFRESFPEQRFLCAADHLMELANNNIPRRYKLLTPISCIGKQKTLVDMRSEKSELYERLSKDKNSKEFLEFFFQYNPIELNKTQRRSMRSMLRKTFKKSTR